MVAAQVRASSFEGAAKTAAKEASIEVVTTDEVAAAQVTLA